MSNSEATRSLFAIALTDGHFCSRRSLCFFFGYTADLTDVDRLISFCSIFPFSLA